MKYSKKHVDQQITKDTRYLEGIIIFLLTLLLYLLIVL